MKVRSGKVLFFIVLDMDSSFWDFPYVAYRLHFTPTQSGDVVTKFLFLLSSWGEFFIIIYHHCWSTFGMLSVTLCSVSHKFPFYFLEVEYWVWRKRLTKRDHHKIFWVKIKLLFRVPVTRTQSKNLAWMKSSTMREMRKFSNFSLSESFTISSYGNSNWLGG